MNKTFEGSGPLYADILATIPAGVTANTREIYVRHAQVTSLLLQRAGITAINAEITEQQRFELDELLVESGFQGKTLGVMSTTLRRVVAGFNFKEWPKLAEAVKVDIKPLDPLSEDAVRKLRRDSRDRSVLAGAVVNTLLDTGALPEELVRVERTDVRGLGTNEPKIRLMNLKSGGTRTLPLSVETGLDIDQLKKASWLLSIPELFPVYNNGKFRAEPLGRQAPWYILNQIDPLATTRRIRETVVMEHAGTRDELAAKLGVANQRADVYLMRKELVFAPKPKD